MQVNVTIIRDRQLAIRRQIDRRRISLKVVEADSGIPHATLLSYFPHEGAREPAAIPMSAVFALLESKALPVDLLDHLLPVGMAFVKLPEGLDHDSVEDACRDYLETKGKAHHKDSPAGRELSDCEREALNRSVINIPIKGRVA